MMSYRNIQKNCIRELQVTCLWSLFTSHKSLSDEFNRLSQSVVLKNRTLLVKIKLLRKPLITSSVFPFTFPHLCLTECEENSVFCLFTWGESFIQSSVRFRVHILKAAKSIQMLSPILDLFLITVLTPFSLLAVRPRFTQPSKMRKRVIARPVGSSVRLKCAASGNPRPDIVWLKDSQPLVDEDAAAGGAGGEGKKKKWTLSLKNLMPKHSGKYTCHVSNKAGEINATYKVEVIRESPLN